MFRGLERPPWWAVIVGGLAVLWLIVGGTIMLTRDHSEPLSRAELERLATAASAADASRAAEQAAASAPPSASPPILMQRSDSGPIRVLFAGDSLTAGAFAFSGKESFRGIVTSTLEEGGDVEATRIGDSGLTTAEVFPQVASAGEGYNLVIVELGTNDVTRSTPRAFADDYRRFLDAIRDHSPDAVLLCTGIWGADSSQVWGMDVTVQRECTARGGGYVPLSSIYQDEGNRGPAGTLRPSDGVKLDDFHPNNAGHTAIAGALLAGLTLS